MKASHAPFTTNRFAVLKGIAMTSIFLALLVFAIFEVVGTIFSPYEPDKEHESRYVDSTREK